MNVDIKFVMLDFEYAEAGEKCCEREVGKAYTAAVPLVELPFPKQVWD